MSRAVTMSVVGWFLGAVGVGLESAKGVAFGASMSEAQMVATRGAQTLRELPVTAQAAISAAIGRDRQGYHVVATDVPAATNESASQAEQLRRGYRLKNLRHGLEAEFTPAGVRVQIGAATLEPKLLGVGYGSAVQAAEAGELWAEANRVEYRRGDVTEWYVNGPLGLEQGFTLVRAPSCRGTSLCGAGVTQQGNGSGPLGIALAMGKDWSAEMEPDGKGVMLAHGSKKVLRYRGLVAYDARGRELPAWMEVNGERLWLRVNDAGAEYPVVVDPVFQEAKLKTSHGATGDWFGKSVAVSGDAVVVGAPYDDIGANTDQGSAYVFVKPQGGWAGLLTEAAKLTASDGAATDRFGESVAISGDTVVVGGSSDKIGNNLHQGSAYVFVKPPGGWAGILTESAKLTAADGTANDNFGYSVAISGDTVVVGAPYKTTNGNLLQGSAYVFVKPPGGWSGFLTETAKLTASDGTANDNFGYSVAISGDTVVVGALSDDIGQNMNQGSAYVFVKPGGGWAGILTENAKLTASDGADRDYFGYSVAINGDTVVVGAPWDDIGANTGQGSAYVFVKPGGGWAGILTENAKLIAADGTARDNFGKSVAISGDTVVVGAPEDNIGEKVVQGSAYVFVKPPGGWMNMTETAKLTASDAEAYDHFGNSVAMSGDTVVVAAPKTLGDNTRQGSAYVFEEVVVTEDCPTMPLSGCDVPRRAVIVMKDHDDDTKDSFTLWLSRGSPKREGSQFGDPRAGAIYTTCVWSGSTLIAQLKAPSGSNWQARFTRRSTGYEYVDSAFAHDGLKRVRVVAGPSGTPKKTSVAVNGKGVNLPDPTIPVTLPVNVTAQVLDSAAQICFGQSFGDRHVKKNRANRTNTVRTFKAVNPP